MGMMDRVYNEDRKNREQASRIVDSNNNPRQGVLKDVRDMGNIPKATNHYWGDTKACN